MSGKLSHNEDITSSLNKDEIKRRIDAFFKKYRITPTIQEDNLIVGVQGSALKTRLIGGIFLRASVLPKQITINLIGNSANAFQMNILWESTFDFGIMTGIKNKYVDYFKLLTEELKALVKD